ncbi:MAG: hypothetical protein DRQ88_11890 [Epsilonproteobacteria bacterium]|nr:MAG: hypothetical protein DRQ88_11890 [Campylobacterota bacterium]RLA65805.1 MAG: hypothetical protein DRQ89_00175 [Campylobacterota bacterium]
MSDTNIKVKIKIKFLIQDHKKIITNLEDMKNFLNEKDIFENSEVIFILLAKLTKLITMHLGLEDKYVYPQLLESDDPKINATANKFKNGMGDLGKVYEKFVNKWDLPKKIQENPQEFINEMNGVIQVLTKRIAAEESDLYPLVA